MHNFQKYDREKDYRYAKSNDFGIIFCFIAYEKTKN